MTIRMENSNNGMSRFFFSYDRGKRWQGPYGLPLFDQKGVMGRTDYIVDGRSRCTLFLTASKANSREGRPFCARTDDGGLTWRFLSFIGPEPVGYAIMPSSARLSPLDLVATIRRQDPPRSWIDAYVSRDDGSTWKFLSTPEPDTGEGNPPSLLRLPDNRLCLIYGSRRQPFGIYARLSGDQGKTWARPIALRDDAGGPTLDTSARSSGPTARLLRSTTIRIKRGRRGTWRPQSGIRASHETAHHRLMSLVLAAQSSLRVLFLGLSFHQGRLHFESRQWRGRLGSSSFVLFACAEPLDDVVEHRREEDAEERHAEHPAEDRRAQRSPHLGAGPLGDAPAARRRR